MPEPILQASTLTENSLSWLWPGFILRGLVTLLLAPPGSGKTFLALDIAARLSRDDSMPSPPNPELPTSPLPKSEILSSPCPKSEIPNPKSQIGPSQILFLTREDDPARILLPRLRAMNADFSRIDISRRKLCGPKKHDFDADSADLRATITDRPDPYTLVIADPIHVASRGRPTKLANPRDLFAALSEIAESQNLPILAIAHTTSSLIHAHPLFAQARLIWTIHNPPEQAGTPSTRILHCAKSNIPSIANPLSFTISDSTIHWLSSRQVPRNLSPIAEAGEFLESALSNGRVSSRDLIDAAAGRGISRRTLFRAKTSLGIQSLKVHDRWIGEIFWLPPGEKSPDGGTVALAPTRIIATPLSEWIGRKERHSSKANPEVPTQCQLSAN